MTYIESIEAEIEKCKQWLIHEFGDHMSIHNSLADLREGVLRATSVVDHDFPEEDPNEQMTPKESEPTQS